MIVVSRSPEETRKIGEALGRAIDPVPRAGMFVALHGDLGAGKTVFTAGLARGMGTPASVAVVSPTFVVARAYPGRAPVHHVDAYHLRSLSELEAAGYEEMGGAGRVTVVEWAERIADALPADRLEVTLTPVPEPVPVEAASEGGVPAANPPRRIEIEATGPHSGRVLERLTAALSPATSA